MSDVAMDRNIIKRITEDLDLTEKGVGSINDISINTKTVTKHTKIIAEHFETPFYTYGPFQINNYCHIQDDYSLEHYNKLNKLI